MILNYFLHTSLNNNPEGHSNLATTSDAAQVWYNVQLFLFLKVPKGCGHSSEDLLPIYVRPLQSTLYGKSQ